MTNDFKNNNKKLEIIKDELKKQNTKINNINSDLENVDEKLKVSNKYVRGFKSFFGFFSNIFSSGSSKSKKNQNNDSIETNEGKGNEDKKENKEIEIIKNMPNYYKSSEDLEFENLKSEIFTMNKNTKAIKNLIKEGNIHCDEMEVKFDKTTDKINKLKQDTKHILN